TLAEAFELLSRAIVELPAPAPHDALRGRMSALHGKEDPLLDTGRFFKLLRQAHDAEVAEVKKLGEDNYEISPNPTQVKRMNAQRREAAAAAPSRAAAEAPASGDGAAAPAAPAPAAASSAALRFRRGSRSPSRLSELSLVGVVTMDEEPPAKADKTDKLEAAKPAKKAAKKKAAKPAKKAAGKTVKAAKKAKAPRKQKA
ncbi:MAG TPA: hypothetical protein VMK53_08890, partial [Gemmatimonadales bacterium]|nr:hypothetical protein [Gemmatimonadales bacterium]